MGNGYIDGKRVTLKHIAEKLSVSHATVSRALSPTRDSMISDEVRGRIQAIASEMGYRPNHAGRALVTGRTGLISLWLWAEAGQTPYHTLVSQAMYNQANQRGYQLIVDLVGNRSVKCLPTKSFDPWNVDSIIAHESGPAIQRLLNGRTRPPVPVVSTGTYHLLANVDQVVIDLGSAAQDAMTHLLDGRKRILYITEQGEGPLGDSRYQVYRDSMTQAGLPLAILQTPTSRQETRNAVRAYISANGCPEACFCHNDDVAVAAYRAICDLGIKVPDDCAIVGCNGTEETSFLEVPLTTIILPIPEMMEIACNFLEQRIQYPDLPLQEATLQASLIIRPSSGGPDIWPT